MFVLVAGVAAVDLRAQNQQAEFNKPFPPHKVIGNVYYVGSEQLASFLITTPEGHILINSSFETTVPVIRAAVEKLGFKFTDIKILLGSHAHGDHMEGDALVKELTKAQVMAMEQDVPALRNMKPGGKEHPIDRVLKDGDEVKLGGTTLVAHRTAGHTKGCTTWTLRVQDGGKSYNVVILGSIGVNRGVRAREQQGVPGNRRRLRPQLQGAALDSRRRVSRRARILLWPAGEVRAAGEGGAESLHRSGRFQGASGSAGEELPGAAGGTEEGAGQVMTRRAFGKAIGGVAAAGSLPPHGASGRPGDPGGAGAFGNTPAASPSNEELCYSSAVDLAARLRKGDVSARDVMSAHLERIARVNPKVNAVVTLVVDRAMAAAARADEVQAQKRPLGPLHGLPVAHKDLVDTAGIRTTRGSPFYRDHVPPAGCAHRGAHSTAGAMTLGKTNTPEFGAGSQTFNTVFGATRNPYDVSKTCGGSSGGAAVSLACGMVPIADGSDTGGSLRNPAAFCNVVGLRPSPGRVPSESGSWSPLSVSGPMARSVADVALFLSAIAGPDPRSPLSIQEDGAGFVPRSTARSRVCASRGGGISAASRSSLKFGEWSMPIAAYSRSLAASSRSPNPTSREWTRRSRSCATPPTTLSTRLSCASALSG